MNLSAIHSQVPALFIANTSTLAMYSTGQLTGVVVDIGTTLCDKSNCLGWDGWDGGWDWYVVGLDMDIRCRCECAWGRVWEGLLGWGSFDIFLSVQVTTCPPVSPSSMGTPCLAPCIAWTSVGPTWTRASAGVNTVRIKRRGSLWHGVRCGFVCVVSLYQYTNTRLLNEKGYTLSERNIFDTFIIRDIKVCIYHLSILVLTRSGATVLCCCRYYHRDATLCANNRCAQLVGQGGCCGRSGLR